MGEILIGFSDKSFLILQLSFPSVELLSVCRGFTTMFDDKEGVL